MSFDADVSVIIAAYNAEKFISRAIVSAMQQTLPPREIIVVDDCSSDGTRPVLEAIARSNSIIRVISLTRNSGPSAARNAGIAIAQGVWLAILDADDAFAPNRLAVLMQFAKETGADFVADGVTYYDAVSGCVTGSCFDNNVTIPDRAICLHDFLAHNLADGHGLDWGLLKPIFCRNVLTELGVTYNPDIRHGEDFHIVVDLLLSGAKFRILTDHFYLYTQRWGAVSRRASGLTRTTIAYGKLKRDTLALLQDSRIAPDQELVALLQQRARGLGRQDDAHFISNAVHTGAFGAIAKKIAKNPSFLPIMLWHIGNALQRRLHVGH